MVGMAQPKLATDPLTALRWESLSPSGPVMSHHVGAIARNTLYLHGGVTEPRSTKPTDTFYCMDLHSRIWNPLKLPGCPALSHHACAVLQDRYLLLIGGWDGKNRTHGVHIFDAQEKTWSEARTTGFPDGAGLSSHTATVGENGDILVVGREGGLRTQRRSGNAFVLTGDPRSNKFTYITHYMGASSRSGHSSHIISNVLLIYGGRDDQAFELHSGYKNGEPIPEVMSQIRKIALRQKPMIKPPSARKNHAAISGDNGVLIYGGETFDGRSREPVADTFYLQIKPNLAWYDLGCSHIPRAGHVICTDGQVTVCHGGESGKNGKGIVHGDSYLISTK